MTALAGLALLALAAVLLTVGAEAFAEHAAGAGRRLGVSTFAIGLLLAGAEPEELATSLSAALRHRPSLAGGDALGANVTMLTLVLGLAALLQPVPLSARVRRYAVGAAGVTGVAALLLIGGVTRVEGAALLAAYVALVAVVWRIEQAPPAFGELAEGERPSRRPVLWVLGGLALMAAGGPVAVLGAERLVRAWHLADSAVGLTLLALATTAELLALVWAAARRNLAELAVAGVLGSAAYNATITLGAAALVRPVPNHGLLPAAVLACGLAALVALVGAWRGRLDRGAGVLLVLAYAAFVTLALR